MLRMIAKEPEDHRVRVGRQKRERMRAHLLKSVFSVCSRETLRDPASIDDVVKDASVSRGTFYKYFDSLDEAISELGLQMADEMVTACCLCTTCWTSRSCGPPRASRCFYCGPQLTGGGAV